MLIEGKKYAPEHLGRVLVLGLGKSGHAALDYLLPLLGTRVDALAVAAGGDTPAARCRRRAGEGGGCRGRVRKRRCGPSCAGCRRLVRFVHREPGHSRDF